ncbi:hypothetical protein V8C42DRAFT_337695 [Trichoderma barbatum]
MSRRPDDLPMSLGLARLRDPSSRPLHAFIPQPHYTHGYGRNDECARQVVMQDSLLGQRKCDKHIESEAATCASGGLLAVIGLFGHVHMEDFTSLLGQGIVAVVAGIPIHRLGFLYHPYSLPRTDMCPRGSPP